jgi:hypothetical protein
VEKPAALAAKREAPAAGLAGVSAKREAAATNGAAFLGETPPCDLKVEQSAKI